MTSSHHLYEVRPRKDCCGFDLMSDALPFGRLWYDGRMQLAPKSLDPARKNGDDVFH